MLEQVDLDTKQREKVKEVINSYVKWFLIVTLLAILGWLIANLLNAHLSLTSLQIRIFQNVGLIIEATALGQRGYSIQTWGGTSPAEKLNQKLFNILSVLGFLFITVSIQL